jgi:uncharacterized membrane protein YhaH (DUF805 family)
LHDINSSGWWQLIGIIPIIAPVGIFVLFYWSAKQGDPVKNRFGSPP